jgi:tetratricopeptide (TPR) repeat protein
MTMRRAITAPLLALAFVATSHPCAIAQESKPTVRHHRVAETAPDDSNSPQVEQAEEAMQQKDFAAAKSLLQKATVAKPGDYRAWFDLGYVYNATDRLEQAIDAYRTSAKAKPDVFESNLNLGLLLAKQGDTAEAAQYLKAATQLTPTAHPDEGRARAWQSLGRVTEASDPQQALAAYEQAAKLNPKDPEAHLSAGALLEKENHLDAAALEYKMAADLDPKSQDALAGMVNVYTKQRKYGEAEAALRKVLAMDSQNASAHMQLGRLLAEEGKSDEAAQELQAGLQAAPDGRAALELGALYMKANKYAEAEQQFRAGVRKIPNDAEAHYALGSALTQQKKYAEAEPEFLTAVKLKPDLYEAYGNLAVVAAENKNYQLAIKALDARAKVLPETPATYFLRATSYDNLKVIPQAVENYQQFLAVDNGKLPDQEWQARHRLVALDPRHSDKYLSKKK